MSNVTTETPAILASEPKVHAPGGVREMLAISVPMVASAACETFMTFTDRWMLARLGPEQMSAAMAGGLTAFMMTTFFLGLTGYSTALVAQYLGAGRKDQCAKAVTQALIVCVVAYPIMLASRPFGHALFQWIETAPAQLGPQTRYFDLLLYGSFLVIARNCLSGFFSGIGRTRIVLVASLIAMVANVLGNYALIFGNFGFPALGIDGAAYGTIFGSGCGFAVLLLAYLRRSNRSEFTINRAAWRYEGAMMRKLVRFGYPAGIEFFLNLLAFDMLILVFHSRSLEAATAVTIVFNWDMVSFVPLLGVNIGVTSLVGRYMGAGNPDIAHRAAMSGLKVAWAYGCCTLLAFSTIPGILVDVFRPIDPQALALFEQARPAAIFMVRLAALYVLADATNLVFSGALRGAGDTFWAMTISVGLHWALVGVLLTQLKVFNARTEMAWLGLVIMIWVFTSVFYARYRSGAWRKIKVVQPTEPRLPALASDRLHEGADL